MSASPASLQSEFGASIEALSCALATGNEQRFYTELDALVQRREFALFGDLSKLTRHLQEALERFRIDSRLVDLAEKEVPNAIHRLDHVLKLTDEAAHRTMDLVEQSCPLAERTAQQATELLPLWQRFRARNMAVEEFQGMVLRLDAFLNAARSDMDSVRNNLAEVLMAQGYQDLSGQIIRGVMKLVTELEHALAELVRLSKRHGDTRRCVSDETRRGFGPAIPGIDNGPAVSDQQDVDALLLGLGV
jgi:chemotaxis protein CheZ